MADYIEFDYHRNPSKDEDPNGAGYHVRINKREIFGIEDISERLERECTVTKADIAAVLVGLRGVVVDVLVHGNVVNLDGICKIEPILGPREGKCQGNEDGNKITLKTVRLHPTKSLVDEVKENMKTCVHRRANHSTQMTLIELYGHLTDFFKDHDTVTRRELEDRYGLTRYMATKYINQFVKEGRLLCPRYKNESEFRPAPGFFGKTRDR